MTPGEDGVGGEGEDHDHVRRRCLDCDSLHADGPICPVCGARRGIVLSDEFTDTDWSVPAALLAGHALLAAAATGGHPGLLLGHAWFVEGACAALLAGGVERMARATRLVVAASVLIHLAYLVYTPQRLFAGLGLVLLLAEVVMLVEDRTRVAVRAARTVAVIAILALALGVGLHHLGWTPPGWWSGVHPGLGPMAVAPAATRR